MVVLCPSRNRPKRALELFETFRDTSHLEDTKLLLVVDQDDPTLGMYHSLIDPYVGKILDILELSPEQTGDLVKATNSAARLVWGSSGIIGHVGDDHRFITSGWDVSISEALKIPGVAYGNDLLQKEKLPTAVFISSEIPKILGWYALPYCQHLYIDNAWKDIGSGIGRLTYLPDIIIEHVHPAAGKIGWDKDYLAVNKLFEPDENSYRKWIKNSYKNDIDKLRRNLS